MKTAAFLTSCLFLFACGASGSNPGTESEAAAPSAAPSTGQEVASATPAPSASAEAPKSQAPAVVAKATKTFPLAAYKFPLSIDLPEDAVITTPPTVDHRDAVSIDASNVALQLLKADASVATIATAKATLKKLAFKPATKFLREDADVVFFERGGPDAIAFLFLTKQGGVTYACRSSGSASSEDELAPALAACKTLKPAP